MFNKKFLSANAAVLKDVVANQEIIMANLAKIRSELVLIKHQQDFLMNETAFIKIRLQRADQELINYDKSKVKIKDLPCTTKKDFLIMEEKMKNNDEYKGLVKQFINNENSIEYSKFLRKNFKKILKDSVAINFTWTSSNGNMPVKDFELIETLIDCTTSKISSCSRNQCETIIKSWFRDAKTRHNTNQTKKPKKITSNDSGTVYDIQMNADECVEGEYNNGDSNDVTYNIEYDENSNTVNIIN